MKDIDLKLREKIKMLDEIDKMIKIPQYQKYQQCSPDLEINTKHRTRNPNNKFLDRYSNSDMSIDLDYPLQQQKGAVSSTSSSKTFNTSKTKLVRDYNKNRQGNTRESNDRQDEVNNIYSNFSLNPNLNQLTEKTEKYEKTNSSYANMNNYNSKGIEMFSTKEQTEPVTGRRKNNNNRLRYNKEAPFNNTPQKVIQSKLTKNTTPKANLAKVGFKGDKSPNNKSPIKYVPTSKQLVNININISNENKSTVGDRLYNQAFYIKDKLDKRRVEGQSNFIRQMTPEITTKAKSIQRDPRKFYERLYPYHKLTTNQIMATNITNLNNEEYLQHPSSHHNISVNLNMNEVNIVHNTPNFDDNNEEEEEMNNRIYRRSPSSKVINYKHKPLLDRNSLRIAENLIPAKERLMMKKKRSKSKDYNSNNHYNQGKETINYLNNNTDNSKTYSRSRSQTPTNRTHDMYSVGLENMKKREIVHKQKKILDGEEFKNYSYKPNIQTRAEALYGRKEKSSDKTVKKEIYDKNVHWKNNVDSRKEKLRQHLSNEMKEVYTFKPQITRDMMPNDEKFIVKRLDQIENYVSKRRGVLQKKKDDENYLKKKFVSGEGYKGKMTVTKEFNLSKDNRGKSRSKDGSRDVNYEGRSTSPANVKVMRDKLRTKEFFQTDYLERELSDRDYNTVTGYRNDTRNKYNCQNRNSNQKNNDENNMFVFMNAINNLHDQLVNFKI